MRAAQPPIASWQVEQRNGIVEVFVVRRRWPLLLIILPAVVIALAAALLMSTMPPRRLVMATGAEGGAYHEFGKQYQAILARAGVELRLLETNGALENLKLLQDENSGVDVTFLQGGITSKTASNGIRCAGDRLCPRRTVISVSRKKGDLK